MSLIPVSLLPCLLRPQVTFFHLFILAGVTSLFLLFPLCLWYLTPDHLCPSHFFFFNPPNFSQPLLCVGHCAGRAPAAGDGDLSVGLRAPPRGLDPSPGMREALLCGECCRVLSTFSSHPCIGLTPMPRKHAPRASALQGATLGLRHL